MSTDTKLLAAQARIKVLRAWIIDSGMVAESDPINHTLSSGDTAELDALIADAERYQILTANLDSTEFLSDLYERIGNRSPTKAELDEAIDAMKEAKK